MKKRCLLIPLFLILAMLLVSCNGGEGTTTPPPPVSPVTGNQSPTASFTAYPTSGVAPLEVSFNASKERYYFIDITMEFSLALPMEFIIALRRKLISRRNIQIIK